MTKEEQKEFFTYKGKVYPKSGNPRYDKYKARIEHKGKEMSLTVSEFESLLTQPCAYCGTTEKIGVDRSDSSLGYSSENAVPCCFMCNIMKHTHSLDTFLNQIKRIHAYLNL